MVCISTYDECHTYEYYYIVIPGNRYRTAVPVVHASKYLVRVLLYEQCMTRNIGGTYLVLIRT